MSEAFRNVEVMNMCVQVFRVINEFVFFVGRSSTKIGSRGSDAGQLNWPRGVAVTPDSRVLVSDSSNHRVSVP